jgi:protein farnesyltransferase subunit beta
MRPDFYHSNYSLAGLSATQYHYTYDPDLQTVDGADQITFRWKVEEKIEGDQVDQLTSLHPIFVIPWGDAEKIKNWFVKKDSK